MNTAFRHDICFALSIEMILPIVSHFISKLP